MILSENNIALDVRSGSYCIYFMDSLKVIDSGDVGAFENFERMELAARCNYKLAQIFEGKYR